MNAAERVRGENEICKYADKKSAQIASNYRKMFSFSILNTSN